MKILMIMAGFFPGKKYGGPPVSVDNFCSLMKGEECYIVTKNHDKGDSTPYDGIEANKWIKRDNCSVIYIPDIEYNKNTFENVIKELEPDLLYLQGLFQGCVLPCLKLSKKYNLKVLLAPRGELCAGAFKKKYKKIPYIYYLKLNRLLKNVSYQSTSEEETRAIIKYLNADERKVHFLTNIPSIPKKAYPRREKKIGEGRFVFLSRIHPKKNLISAIRYFQNVHGKATFDIYGPLEDEEYWKECQQEISKLPSNVSVNYCGLVSHEEVHEVFSNYDAFLFPTFSENYGHVIAEALAVGTPVIISDQTPWNDVNEAGAGWAIPLNNEDDFKNAISSIIELDSSLSINKSNLAQNYFKKKSRINSIQEEYAHVIRNI